MKKLLLISFLFFSASILTAQTFNQPSQFNTVCDDNGDGFSSFYLGEITYEILGNNSPQNYTITHHQTLADAQNGVNPLPETYFNTNSYLQNLYARIVTNSSGQFQIMSYQLHAVQPNQGASFALQKCSTATCWNLNSMGSEVSLGQSGSSVTYYASESNALSSTNAITDVSCYVHPLELDSATVFYRVDHLFSSECPTIGVIQLSTVNCVPCEAPTDIVITGTETTVTLNWAAGTNQAYWSIAASVNGTAYQNITVEQNQYTFTNLVCGATYTFSISAYCTSGNVATSGPYTFATMPCVGTAGQPTSLQLCSDTATACFDLTANTPLIINTLNPAVYTVTYYTTQANANAAVLPLINPSSFCSGSQVIYARLENNATQEFQIMVFEVIVNTVSNTVTTLASMDQCDDNSDSSVIFNLTNAQAQINSNNALVYYTSLANAQNQVSPIANPSTFAVSIPTTGTTIFIREIVLNGCDTLYSFQLRAYSICNLAVTCAQANSLCGALGTPFQNTQNATSEPGNNYGCLSSQPNPTWFYLPVSGNGTINLDIRQATDINFVNPIDVDFIAYGPFTNPITPCNGPLTANNIVSCSYSPSATEQAIIPNAVVGQYYMIMVTNYSNRAGYIKITEMSNTVGSINCSGLRLNAFLDTNSNGTQDSGEVNFPLGQFTYEVNDNSNVHNIISSSGVYNIYDANISNSYDFSFAVDSNYASQYNVGTASYSNINVSGSGMTVYNFPVTVAQPYNDLAVNIVPLSAPRPGFTYQEKIIYTNNGNQTVTSGTVSFNNQALTTITANTQAGTTPTTNGFTYNFTNLLPFETRSMIVTMQVPTIPTVLLGNLLTNIASIAPLTGDVVPANNSASCSQIIIGSYDPNDKMEAHGEKILYSSFTSNDYLIYTIRFENSGTASAINVRINDVLDSKLDSASIKMLSSSHPYVLDRLENTLNWKFDNIQLPPSVANTTTGKGYVTFKIKPKSSFAVGDIIPNTASIYFDFNPAIVTNTFKTEFVQQLSVGEFENGDFVFYPNPVSDILTVSLKNNGSIATIVVYDVLGKMIVSQKPNNSVSTQTIDLSAIAKGIYLLEVTTDSNQKVIKKFLLE